MTKPLDGLKVLDFSAVYAGPICTRMLADCGAEVVKIETPGQGDVIRGPKGMSRVYAHFNTGKRSIAIDLKAEAGQRIARELMAEADVVVENFRPGVMRQFGLDYDSVKVAFPALVYCSISGFGQTGPYVKRAAYAPIAHAASGFDHSLVAAQSDPDAKPPVWSIMIADMLTGSYAFGAIQTALLGRHKSGAGNYIDVTMLESMMSLIPSQLQAAQIDRKQAAVGFHPITVTDGFVMVCIVSEKNMKCLARAMENPAMLENPRFKYGERWKHTPEFIQEIERWSVNLSSAECEARLNDAGVPCSPYNAPGDLFAHPQILARSTFQTLSDEYGDYLVQNSPFRFGSADISTATQVARLGEHTDEVLATSLDMTGEQIAELRSKGVVA